MAETTSDALEAATADAIPETDAISSGFLFFCAAAEAADASAANTFLLLYGLPFSWQPIFLSVNFKLFTFP